MANFQIIFSGNEDDLYRFVLTWKMSSDVKKYDELKQQVQALEERVKELREKISELEDERMRLQREVAELTSLRESIKRELAIHGREIESGGRL
ncbi:MAG: hypothetical protein RMI78_03855 [Nitrososphaerota archaeon]|nr:hypothetical protein [Nitrososphaerota archaeon]